MDYPVVIKTSIALS